MKHTRLLVTGYPGWLTNRFLSTLQNYSHGFSSIRCLSQSGCSHHEDKSPPDLEIFVGDLRNPEQIQKAFNNIDVVLHAAGVLHVKKISDFYAINRDGTCNVIDASVAAGVKKFIYISSNAAQGFCDAKGSPLTESDACVPESEYGQSKYEAEQIVQERQREGRIETVILRPAMFYGPPVPDRHLDIYRKIKAGFFPIFGSGNYFRSVTYIDNLIQAIHLAINADAANGQIYSVADEQIPTLNDIIRVIGKAIGRDVRIIRLPVAFAKFADLADREIAKRGYYWMLPHVVGESFRNIACSIDKAKAELGYCPKINYEEGYRRTIAWCSENKKL